ncbi:peptide chain release factor N(5)-glutamine methyltransferase [Halioxenophilus sp. WMMB6]|uniref:peptide chain release factor N(5)-glutamine methyltransferase n=1 Tax=Halioxenophilus sp. WMMB6 TaxID=3073815 RepID=UPI00295E9471|nr:peptide chain release factor N(5)-glutamine methyltransferase [Halioxenophilus sp. WMMB6]
MLAAGSSIATCLRWAGTQLSESDSPRLDAELLLAFTLERERTYLFTWPEKPLAEAELQQFASLVAERRRGVPVAYLLGRQGFWDLTLTVTGATLIPRPETELLVELALAKPVAGTQVLDLGTGSGAIALALARQRPDWQLLAVDNSAEALAVARHNGQRNHIGNITFLQSDWFAGLPEESHFGMIVSNPPYIDATDPHLQQGDLRFEPVTALVAAEAGLADIRRIASDARAHLAPGGWLLFEHGYNQEQACQELLNELGYAQVACHRDLNNNPRVSEGQWPGEVGASHAR